MKLLSISTDRKIFEQGSPVRTRQAGYAKNTEETNIIVFADKSFREDVCAPNCFVYPTKSFSKLMYHLDAIRLGSFIIERRGMTNITCQDPFQTAMAGIALKKKYKLPLEIQVHTDIGSPNYPYSIGNKVRKSLALSYLPKADHIRVVSERIKKYLIESLKIPSEKIEVRPISVDVEKIKNATKIVDLKSKYAPFQKFVIMATRFEKEKNVSLALHAWKKVKEQLGPVALVIIGNGSENVKLRQLENDLGLKHSVFFEPWANPEALYSYYKTANVFLNTSLYEGYGMSMVEAQAGGCKLVSTDVGIARELGAEIVGFTSESVAAGIIKQLS